MISHYFVQLPTPARFPPRKAREHQMRRGTDRQKFGYALNERQQRQKCERHRLAAGSALLQEGR